MGITGYHWKWILWRSDSSLIIILFLYYCDFLTITDILFIGTEILSHPNTPSHSSESSCQWKIELRHYGLI